MPKSSKVRTEQVGDLIDMYNEEKRENKRLKEIIADFRKDLNNACLADNIKFNQFPHLERILEKLEKEQKQQTTIKCEWCSSTTPPFTKLREGDGFICKRCYESLKDH